MSAAFARLAGIFILPGSAPRGGEVSAFLLVLLSVFVLAGQLALHIARQDADPALRTQASAQLALLAQALTPATRMRDHAEIEVQIALSLERDTLQYAAFSSPGGRTVQV
ncbi:MAG: hypothetical protein ACK4UX_05405 [Thiobacillus sp.]